MDFYGFSFNGHHSSELGIIRVSDGSRYSDNLTPNFQDKTVAIPGGDGTYFFESFYNQKPFTINIAFDSLTEAQLRKLRQVFNGKDVGPLVFDEEPYKAYTVKLQSPVQLKYICFDKYIPPMKGLYDFSIKEEARFTQERVYKGEGTINFIAYKPYAQSRHLYLDDFKSQPDTIDLIAQKNMDEWKEASAMYTNASEVEREFASYFTSNIIEPNNTAPEWAAYNPGDVDMGFKLYIDKGSVQSCLVFNVNQTIINADDSGASEEYATMQFDFTNLSNRLEADSDATIICINTTNELVEGCTETHDLTGYLYNDAVKGGYLFKIPPSPTKRFLSTVEISVVTSSSSSGGEINSIAGNSVINIKSVDRHYLYY